MNLHNANQDLMKISQGRIIIILYLLRGVISSLSSIYPHCKYLIFGNTL